MSKIIRCGAEHAIAIQVFTPPLLWSNAFEDGDEETTISAKEQNPREDFKEPGTAISAQNEQVSEDSGEGQRELILRQAQEEAARCLAAAQEEAARCLAAARKEAAALKEEAAKQGFLEGEEAGKRQGLQQLDTAIRSLQQAAEELTHLRGELLRCAEEDIVTLAFHIARVIIRQEILLNRDVILSTVQRALESLVDRENILIRVHPDDLERVMAAKKELFESLKGIKTLSFQGDEMIDRGGCIIESEFGEIDARIMEQIAEVEKRFRERLSLLSEEKD